MAHQPDIRPPNRRPDGYAIIDKQGRIMGGKNIPLLQHQIIFDCLASYSDFKAAKKAMLAARPGAPAHARICFFHHHRITAALIRVDPLDPHYLLGGWHLPNPLIPHPYIRYALC